MALSDPISITVGGGAKSFAKIVNGDRNSTYAFDVSETDKYRLLVSHVEGKRRRSVVRVDHSEIISDVFTNNNSSNLQSGSLYLVVDRPIYGFADAEYSDLYTGLTGALEASSSALLTKFLRGES
jgi:hypothetical protein